MFKFQTQMREMDILSLFHFRLRGFYGIVHVDKEETEIVLTEARSGEEQMRWKISSVNRVFCPKTVCKRDKNKILVIITKRSVMSIACDSLYQYQGILSSSMSSPRALRDHIYEYN